MLLFLDVKKVESHLLEIEKLFYHLHEELGEEETSEVLVYSEDVGLAIKGGGETTPPKVGHLRVV